MKNYKTIRELIGDTIFECFKCPSLPDERATFMRDVQITILSLYDADTSKLPLTRRVMYRAFAKILKEGLEEGFCKTNDYLNERGL